MKQKIEASLSKDCFTAGSMIGFELFFENTDGDDVEFKNDHGCMAEDIPDIGSGKVLADTAYYYIYFKYGDDEEDITTKEDAGDINVYCQSGQWDVVSATDPVIGKYWKIVPTESFILQGTEGENRECVLTFSRIRCSGMIGKAKMYIQSQDPDDIITLLIEKCRRPNISDAGPVDDRQYDLGEEVKITWTVEFYFDFDIYLDGSKINQDDEKYITSVTARHEDYRVRVTNRAGDEVCASVKCRINTTENFEIVEIHKNSVRFRWKAVEKNVRRCGIDGFEDNLALCGEKEFATEDITTDKTFSFWTELKDDRGSIEETETEFKCPVIKEFAYGVQAGGGRTDFPESLPEPDENVKHGFLSAAFVKRYINDPDICIPCSVSCKGGGGPNIFQYRWDGVNVKEYYVELTDGERSETYGADAKGGEIKTYSGNHQATLLATGMGKYEVTKECD